MRKKDIKIGETYISSGAHYLFRITEDLGKGKWEMEVISTLPYVVGNKIVERPWHEGRTRTTSRNILRPFTEEQFEQSRRERVEDLKKRINRNIAAQSQMLFESEMGIYRNSWVHSPIISWKIYSDFDRIDNGNAEESIDSQMTELKRIRRSRAQRQYRNVEIRPAFEPYIRF